MGIEVKIGVGIWLRVGKGIGVDYRTGSWNRKEKSITIEGFMKPDGEIGINNFSVISLNTYGLRIF